MIITFANKKAKTVSISATVKIKGVSYKVTGIAKNAFKGITKKTAIKVPKKKVSSYKKIFKSKGLSSKVKVKA